MGGMFFVSESSQAMYSPAEQVDLRGIGSDLQEINGLFNNVLNTFL